MNDYKFGNFLCARREFKGLTQSELAKMLSVTPAAVSKWENGESKPRIETLFKLADILDVTAEELMAGEFIVKEEDDDDDESRIKYEYLKSLDTLLEGKVRIKRIFAFLLDWNVLGILPIAIGGIIFLIYPVQGRITSEEEKKFIFAIVLLSVLTWFLSFAFRDFIFKGRSIGKRVFGLNIIDRNTGDAPSKKQLLIRNLFFFIQTIDGIIMLIRGISIGDSLAQTFVVSKEQLENKEKFCNDKENINKYISANKDKKRIVKFLIFGVIFYFILGIIVNTTIFSFERSEPYQVAYNYLLESESYKKLTVDKERIKWSSISGNGIINKSDTNEVVFLVEGKEYKVISHRENGVWKVCGECTEFR